MAFTYVPASIISGVPGGLIWNADNSWDLVIPAAIADGTYDVTAIVTDIAGNSISDPGSSELVIDTVTPVAPAFDPLITGVNTPSLQGFATVGPGETLEVIVNGITYTGGDGNLFINADGTWTLNIPPERCTAGRQLSG